MSQSESPVSVTAERFLREIMARIPLDRIEELHLFSPLRQGTVETGIAVVAALELIPPVEAAVVSDPELPLPAEVAAGEPVIAPSAELVDEPVDESVDEPLDESVDEQVEEPVDAPMAELVDELPAEVHAEPAVRHTVYTARYRHVIKGPDRGKWEADVKAEAEAPLVTVETVVRGVQRRAGEESEIVRYTAPQLARLLRVTAPA